MLNFLLIPRSMIQENDIKIEITHITGTTRKLHVHWSLESACDIDQRKL